MLYGYMTHRLKWKSRYSLLFFHVTIRVASQACGLVFGMLGFENTDVFLAYLILGAEGYFTLVRTLHVCFLIRAVTDIGILQVLCTGRFLVSWHQHNLPSHESWLEPRSKPGERKFTVKTLALIFLGPLAMLAYHDNPMMIFHSVLIIANVLIITGMCQVHNTLYTFFAYILFQVAPISLEPTLLRVTMLTKWSLRRL